MKRSKKYRAATEKYDVTNIYAPVEAMKIVRETSVTKYDSTVEVSLALGVDPRKADQAIRGTVNLPHGTGKTARVLVFAGGERAEEAAAGRAIRANGGRVESPDRARPRSKFAGTVAGRHAASRSSV